LQAAALEAWLARLLAALIVSLGHAEEPSPAIWAAALSCFCAFGTSSAGETDGQAVRVLLERCVQFQWAPVVHSHLVRLAVSRLYVPRAVGAFLSPYRPYCWKRCVRFQWAFQ
jgi:hypothetical protein